MANKLTPETMALAKSENPYDWMTFIRQYCKTYRYRINWNKALSVRIYPQLREIISKKILSSKQLYLALRYHVKSPQYLKILILKGERININGKPDGRVTQEEGNRAWSELCTHHPKAARELRNSHKKKKQIRVVTGSNRKLSEPEGDNATPKPRRKLVLNPRKGE